MRHIKLLLVLTGFAATLFAADPFAGTWTLNSAKTKFRMGTAPKEQTVTITEAGSDLNVKVNGTLADGNKIAMNYTIPSKGGPGKILEGASYDGIAGKRLGPNEREVRYMKAGKAVYTTHSKISPDGNSLTVLSKGLSPAGQSVDATVFYDKQK